MPSTIHQVGATSKIVTMRAWVISTGLPYTAGAFNTSGLVVTYCRDGATAQTITQVTATAGTYTSSGFVHRVDGVYEIGAPAASLLTGADGVTFTASGITDVVFEAVRVELVGTDPRSADAPDVNVTKVAGTTQTAGDLVALITTVDDLIDTEVGALTTAVADLPTNAELATALASADDAVLAQVALVKAKTDLIPADPADASDIAGSFATVNTKLDTIDDLLDTELPALTTAVDALPTNAELATALAAADDAVLAAIAALNNLSSAGAQAAAAAALAAFNAATAANVAAVPAAVLAAATAAPIAANVKAVNDVTLTGTGVLGDEWGPA